ncbi:hypothetical protein ACFWP3_16800 [Streptomyces sp. NPDC058525]|uniref:hypothetical protein n=1 Tax=unclassified Streptomyces TaxID=2593676 RepID=UPI003669BA4F
MTVGPVRVPGHGPGRGRRTVDHPLTGAQVRDIASGQSGELMEVSEEWHGNRAIRIAHIRPAGGGFEWSTAMDNISPVGGGPGE